MTKFLRPAGAIEAPTDAELLERVHSGDRDALGLLYDRHAQSVYGFVRRLTSREEAEDIVQTTFIRLSNVAGSFDARGLSARGWIHGVAYHVYRERRRTLVRFRQIIAEYTAEKLGVRHASSHEAVDVERALSRLSEPKRTVLVLTQVHGFTSEEVARMLDVPLGTVWTRLHHARRDLKALLEGEAP